MCVLEYCDEGDRMYNSSVAWETHMSTMHNLEAFKSCPLCNSTHQISLSHVATHMEHIALLTVLLQRTETATQDYDASKISFRGDDGHGDDSGSPGNDVDSLKGWSSDSEQSFGQEDNSEALSDIPLEFD